MKPWWYFGVRNTSNGKIGWWDMGEWKPRKWLLFVGLILVGSVFWLGFGWMMGDRQMGCGDSHTLKDYGPVGDYFGGMMGPIVGLIGALLTFAAFYIQYKANQEQSVRMDRQEDQLKLQEKQQRRDRFEQRFFEMLRIHRENMSEFVIEVKNGKDVETFRGREAFHLAVREIEATYELLWNITGFEFLKDMDARSTMATAFLLTYWGIKGKSSFGNQPKRFMLSQPMNTDESKRFQSLTDTFNRGLLNYAGQYSQALLDVLNPAAKAPHSIDRLKEFEFPGGFYLWEGTFIYLSHYLRHLIRMMEMLSDKSFDDVFEEEDRRQFARILRSQLSDDEQKILFYQSLTNIGYMWWSKGWLARFRLYKNIPTSDLPGDFSAIKIVDEYLLQAFRAGSYSLDDHFDDIEDDIVDYPSKD